MNSFRKFLNLLFYILITLVRELLKGSFFILEELVKLTIKGLQAWLRLFQGQAMVGKTIIFVFSMCSLCFIWSITAGILSPTPKPRAQAAIRETTINPTVKPDSIQEESGQKADSSVNALSSKGSETTAASVEEVAVISPTKPPAAPTAVSATPVADTPTPVATNLPAATPSRKATEAPSVTPTRRVQPPPIIGVSPTPDRRGELDTAVVAYIIDGDTIAVTMNGQEYRLRYIGIDSPEANDPFGAEATAANRRLVDGKTVTLEKDVSDTDRFGRLLRYVYLADGTMVNETLVREGFAISRAYPPDTKYQARLDRAQSAAVSAAAGVWGTAGPPAAIIAVSSANLRSGPGTSYEVVGVGRQNDRLEIIASGSNGQWYNVRLPDGSRAWVAASVVTTAGVLSGIRSAATIPAPPVIQAAPTRAPAAAPQPTAAPVTAPPVVSNCDPSYPDVCIPPYPPDLDCKDIPYRRFRVLPPDPHRFDGDKDGIGCESG